MQKIIDNSKISSKNEKMKNFQMKLIFFFFFCIVRWLSSYNVLNRFVDLFDPITAFLKEKKINYSELDDECRGKFANTEFTIAGQR